MNNSKYLCEQAALSSRAFQLAQYLDSITAARVARETAAAKRAIAPQRVDPPVLLPAEPTQTAQPPAPPGRPDPFLRAVLRHIQLGK
jgi:hypothetical protein